MTFQYVYGQKYTPFPESNAVWSVYNEKYLINGDSIFNTINYKKYYFTTDSLANPTKAHFFALVRQDSSTKKVYFIPSGKSIEYLLYGFSLNVGEETAVYSLSVELFGLSSFTVQVESKDSILIN